MESVQKSRNLKTQAKVWMSLFFSKSGGGERISGDGSVRLKLKHDLFV